MSTLEQHQALRRSALWVARQIDFTSTTDQELLQIIELQPAGLWNGAARAIAARWEARRRGFVVAKLLPGDYLGEDQPPPKAAPSPPALDHPMENAEPDDLLVSLILSDPG
jgi:hypothetical protein